MIFALGLAQSPLSAQLRHPRPRSTTGALRRLRPSEGVANGSNRPKDAFPRIPVRLPWTAHLEPDSGCDVGVVVMVGCAPAEGPMTGKRKLAAILSADVVGFSRLTSADEDRTLARLRALRSESHRSHHRRAQRTCVQAHRRSSAGRWWRR